MRHYAAIIVLTAVLIIGCSDGGSGNFPTVPEFSERVVTESGSDSIVLWGLWDISYDLDTCELSVIPMRSADETWNVTKFLQPPIGNPASLGVNILDATDLISQGRIDVRVTVNHPFPSSKLRGFDVRGVVMGNGSITDPYNTDLIYPAHTDLRLLNADGYTRWMNATEFNGGGFFSYVPGFLGSKNYTPSATLNGYKYFAELIEPEQDVYDYFSSSLAYVANRGSMTPGTSISRDYELQFPTAPLQVRFQYAVIAGWWPNETGGDNPSPADFPQNANCIEPMSINIVDSSTVYLESPTKKGGDISLRLNIVDWLAYWDPDNLEDYISKIIITSNAITFPGGDYVEYDFADLDYYPTSAGNAEAVDILIADVEPSGVENQDILIAVEMIDLDYTNPFNVPNSAGADPLTGYFLHTLHVATEINDPPVITSGVDGPSEQFITDVSTYSVDASDEDNPVLDYEWTVRDPLFGTVLFGPSAGDGEGNWDIDWAVADIPGYVEVHCVVSDGENEVEAEPLEVYVDDIIFHADLSDTITGDNTGWTTTESQGTSDWIGYVSDDNVLPGYGYKFGPFNTNYSNNSADILVTPAISIPSNIDRAVVVVFHSYDWDYYAPLEVGFDGSNFKVTEFPDLPTYDTPEAEIIAGKDYDGWLFDTAISDQLAFYSDEFKTDLQTSAFEIPSDYFGSQAYISFAAATDDQNLAPNHGWLIDDVQVRALPVDGNGPPIPAGHVEGDVLLPLTESYPGTYTAIGYDLEDDPLTYIWTVRDPDTGDILYGPIDGGSSGEIEIEWTMIVLPGVYDVHCSIYDGSNPGVAVPPLTVTIQDPLFQADFSDTTTGDNAGWSGYLESGATSWTNSVGSDSVLKGFGYKWGDFDTPYQVNSQGILLSPEIVIPAGIAKVSIYIRHDFQFIATFDGGNFKVTKSPALPDFSMSEENIDGGFNYDVKLDGTVMDNQDAFGIGMTSSDGLMSRMDLASSFHGSTIRIGIAAASGTVYYGQRGWLIDDVVVAVTQN